MPCRWRHTFSPHCRHITLRLFSLSPRFADSRQRAMPLHAAADAIIDFIAALTRFRAMMRHC